MNIKTHPGALAFPVTYEEEYGDHGMKQLVTHNGLTKREYFAAIAMQGILSDQTFVQPNQMDEVVMRSVKLADALITELNK